jgi:hypothetical protein
MQTLSSQRPNNVSHQTRKIAIMAILLFALSGLISGFAVGTFVRPKIGSETATHTGSGTTPVAQNTKTTVTTTSSENVNLGFPSITQANPYFQIANGSTNYTLSALIIDKSNHPIQVSDVTCKLWLTKGGDVNAILRADDYAIAKEFDRIQQPFPQEAVSALNFISPTQQTQPCTPNGKTTWNYTISPSVDPGRYHFVVLADWKGKHYNWSWVDITIKKGD